MRNEIRRLMGQELHSLVVQKSGNVNPFCEQNGFSATHLWKVIKGTGNVGVDQLERYCEKLGISLDRFLYASLTQIALLHEHRARVTNGHIRAVLLSVYHGMKQGLDFYGGLCYNLRDIF